MEAYNTPSYKIILLSLLMAFMLIMMPLPDWAMPFRPNWVALILLYWVINTPAKINIVAAFICGLILDVALGTLLGQHAIGLVIIAFIGLRLHQRMRFYPMVQQSVIIMFLLFIKQLLVLWVYGITDRAPENMSLYFSASFTGMLFWPWVSGLLNQVSRKHTSH